MRLAFIFCAAFVMGYLTNSAIAYVERIRRSMRERPAVKQWERHYDSDSAS